MTFTRRAGLAGALALVAISSLASVALANPNAEVSIVEKSFDPNQTTVEAGTTVVWTVTKSIGEPHTVTSGKLGDADAGKLFDSGMILKDDGQTYQFTFTSPGTFTYFCTVHPTEMTGTITVTGTAASGAPAPSAAAGSPAPAESGAPAGSGAPGPSAAPLPPGAEHEPVPTSSKLAAAGILVVALVILFVAAMLYRRFNRV
jgi:plastocyanin